MASTRQRKRSDGTTTYEVLFRHQGRQRSETFNTAKAQAKFKRDVDTLGAEVALEILNRIDGTQEEVPLLADYMEERFKLATGITEGTRRDNLRVAKLVRATPMGRLPVDLVTADMVRAWIAKMEREGLAAKTIKNRHATLSGALNQAVEADIIHRNPAKGIQIRATTTEDMVFLSPAEFRIIYDRIPETQPHYRALARFLFGTGARIGEATALQIKDLRLGETPATVSIVRAWKATKGGGHEIGPPKTKRGRRTIAIGQEIVDDLRPLIKDRAPDDWIFLNRDGGPVRSGQFWELWSRWRDDERYDGPKLGKVPRVHDLRHSHASFMIGKGVSLFDLQHRLGHESIETTAGTYGHLLPEAMIQAARLSDLMFDAEKTQAKLTAKRGRKPKQIEA